MTDIMKRVAALEQRENEHWEALRAHLKSFSLIVDCIGAPICAANPDLLPVIIKNLKGYEKEARLQNHHSVLLWQLGSTRKFFEERQKLAAKDEASHARKSKK